MKIQKYMTSIMIMGEKFAIKRKRLKKDLWADVDPVTRNVRMSDKLDDLGFKNVLGHEISHIVLSNTGLATFITPEQEEKFCDALGRAIVQLIEENTTEEGKNE